MTLKDLIAKIDDLDDELTIYVTPEWTEDSPAVVGQEHEGGGVPAEAAKIGAKYFLETFIAKEVLEGLRREPLDAKVRRLIQYAINDA